MHASVPLEKWSDFSWAYLGLYVNRVKILLWNKHQTNLCIDATWWLCKQSATLLASQKEFLPAVVMPQYLPCWHWFVIVKGNLISVSDNLEIVMLKKKKKKPPNNQTKKTQKTLSVL